MKISKIIKGALVLPLLMAAGCVDDMMDRPISVTEGGDAIEAPYTVDGELMVTRGIPASAAETRLKEAYVLFFYNPLDNPADDLTGFVAYSKVYVKQSTGKLTFDPPADLNPDTDYDVLALGNVADYLPEGVSDMDGLLAKYGGKSRAEVEQTLAIHAGYEVNNRAPGVMPLWGRYVKADDTDAEQPFRFQKETSDAGVVSYKVNGSFRFSRAISRLDVTNLVPGTLDIRWVKVCNYRDGGYVFQDNRLPEESRIVTLTEPSPAPSVDAPGDYVAMDGEYDGVQNLKSKLYAFPNYNETCVQNDEKTTCLIIAGYYTDPATATKDSELTYYRFNYANAGSSQLLKRNYAYTAVIKGVLRRGAADDKTAYNDQTPIFDYDVEDEWDITDDNYASDGDGNFLVVSRSQLVFKGGQSSADCVEVRVSTNPALKWSLVPETKEGADNSKFICERIGTSNALKCGPVEKNEEDYLRCGYWKIVAERVDGRPLKKALEIHLTLQQLTMDNNFKCLQVDGKTGLIQLNASEVSGENTSLSFKVVTGNDLYTWVTSSTDFNSKFGQSAKFSASGGDGSLLTVTLPANLTGAERTATITVSLTPKDPHVPDVTIRITQPKSKALMSVTSNGTPLRNGQILEFDAFQKTTGNANGVAVAYPISVNAVSDVEDAQYFQYKVISSFDRFRDLRLYSGPLIGSSILLKDGDRAHANTAILNANSVFNYATCTLGEATQPNNDIITDRTDVMDGIAMGNGFYLNIYRTGPTDGQITGTITIICYDRRYPNDTKRQQSVSLTVRIKPSVAKIYDVVLKANNGTLWLYPDRGLGASSRVTGKKVADYYTWQTFYRINDDAGAHNPNMDKSMEIYAYEDYLGNRSPQLSWQAAQVVKGGAFQSTTTASWPLDNKNLGDGLVQFVTVQQGDPNQKYSPFYTATTNWSNVTGPGHNEFMANSLCFSKCRAFLVSAISCSNGTPVCCWIHQCMKGLCTAYYSNKSTSIYWCNNANSWSWFAALTHNSFTAQHVAQGGTSQNYYYCVCRGYVRQLTTTSEQTQYRQYADKF